MTRQLSLFRTWAVAFVVFLCCGLLVAGDIPLTNWAIPTKHLAIGANADISNPGFFIAVTPCRVVDTRNANGPFGGPKLVGGASRSFAIPSGPCAGIPAVAAYSLNLTVTQPEANNGFLKAYPTGSAQPLVASLNFNANETKGNAAIVPANGSGSIDIFTNVNTHLIMDINGYFFDNNHTMAPQEWVGIYGTYDNGGTFFVWNFSTNSGASTSSIRGYTNNVNGGQAILGQSAGTTGTTYGVKGTNASTTPLSAGVYGTAGAPAALSGGGYCGVFGNTDAAGFGVLGVSQATAVFGDLVDSSGTFLRGGRLGYSTYGVYAQGDYGGTGAKFFVEPHPLDASKVIRYVALEGPESGTYFRGKGRFARGSATIEVPEDFRMVTDAEGLTVQITPIGKPTAVGVVRIGLDRIEVEATRDVEFSYLVQGVRKAFKNFNPISEGSEFVPESPDERIPAYLTEEAKSRLIANGTYNADGSVNMETAERMGWAAQWREREAKAQALAKQQPPADPQVTKGPGRIVH
jgi:hypothetical protein